MSKRRVAGQIVYKRPGAGFSGQGSYVMLEAEVNHEPCVMGCGDPDCCGWSDCRGYDDSLRPTDVWFYHVYECQMDDVWEPEAEPT